MPKGTFTKDEAAAIFKQDNTSGDAGPHDNPEKQCQCDGCKTHRGEKAPKASK